MKKFSQISWYQSLQFNKTAALGKRIYSDDQTRHSPFLKSF